MVKEKKEKKEKKKNKANDDVPGGFTLPEDYKPESRDAIPAGKYLVNLVKVEKKDTKSGDGQYLSCQFKVLKGEYKGRVIFENVNAINPSEKAVEIAEGFRNNLMFAAKVRTLPYNWDFTPLLNIPVVARVKIEPGDEQYPDNNRITGFVIPEEAPAETEPEEGKKKKKDKKKKKKDKAAFDDAPF